jgi:hypothetical protein
MLFVDVGVQEPREKVAQNSFENVIREQRLLISEKRTLSFFFFLPKMAGRRKKRVFHHERELHLNKRHFNAGLVRISPRRQTISLGNFQKKILDKEINEISRVGVGKTRKRKQIHLENSKQSNDCETSWKACWRNNVKKSDHNET